MNKVHTRKLNKIPNNLSREIVERALPKVEMEKFMSRYNKAKKTTSGMNREVNLKREITNFEKSALDHFMNATDEPMREFAETSGKPVSQCMAAANRAARKIVYQNLEKITHVLK